MNDQGIHQRIDAILAELDPPSDTSAYACPATDEANTSSQHTIIDVYIVEHTEQEPLTVEGTLASDQEANQHDDEEPATISPPSTRGVAPARPHRRWVLAAFVLLVCAVLLGAGATSYLLSVFTPSATITIVTHTQTLTTQTTLQVVTNGTADLTKNQILGRMLPSVTMSQQQTVPTTGTTHQNAQAAHGVITFYNGATYPQTIAAGTLLTGTDGVQLVTDADATIPAALFPTFGQASVFAHAVLTGPEGNIRAGDIYGACCRLNISAVNRAFTGGQDARTYPSVTQQDITNVVTSIKTSVEQSIQAALQIQVHASETLITPLACMMKTMPDSQIGKEATQVSVTVNETCTGATYSTDAVTTLATQRATKDAQQKLGQAYTTTDVQTRITQVTPEAHGILDLHLTSRSLWTMQMGDAQQQALKAMIAGKSKEQAITRLLHVAGVQSVAITLTSTRSNTLPTSSQLLHLLFVQLS